MYRGLGPKITAWLSQYTGEWAAGLTSSFIASFLALMLSWLSFKYFESYFLKMKNKFT
jgi:peptidoglycan/LPS O-acetylase OafA/YrhL